MNVQRIVRGREFKILLILLIIVVFILELSLIEKRNRDLDELISVYSANGMYGISTDTVFYQNDVLGHADFASMLKANSLRDSGNSIAHDIVLYGWVKAFGNSLFATRSLSLIFYLVSIGLIFILSGFFVKSELVAFLASFCFAFHPLIFMYGTTARTYSFAIFFVLFDTFLFFKWRSSLVAGQKKISLFNMQMLLYAAALSFSLLVHYYFVYLLLIHFCFLLPRIIKDIKGSIPDLLPYVISLICLAVRMFLGGMESWTRMTTRSDDLLAFASGNSPDDFLTLTTFDTVVRYLNTTFQDWIFTHRYYFYFDFGLQMRYVVIAFLPPIIFIAYFFIGKIKWRSDITLNNKWFLSSLVFISVAMALLHAFLSGHTIAFLPRYLFISLPFFMLLLGIGAGTLWQASNSRFFKITMIALYIVFLGNIVMNWVFWKQDKDISINAFKQMGEQVKVEIDKIKKRNEYTILHHDEHEAECFNFHCRAEGFKQKIDSSAVKSNEIILSNDKDSSRTVLYKYPFDFTRLAP